MAILDSLLLSDRPVFSCREATLHLLHRRPIGTGNIVFKLLIATLTLVSCSLQVCAQSAEVEDKRPAKRLVQPVIPELATKLNLSGAVKIEVTIAPDGTVKSTRIVGGHPVLAAAAESAAQKSTFQPGPKETVEVIEFRFSGK
jgi:TonB family protein